MKKKERKWSEYKQSLKKNEKIAEEERIERKKAGKTDDGKYQTIDEQDKAAAEAMLELSMQSPCPLCGDKGCGCNEK